LHEWLTRRLNYLFAFSDVNEILAVQSGESEHGSEIATMSSVSSERVEGTLENFALMD